MEGDLFQAGDLEALALFYGMHEVAGFQQGFVSASIQPSEATAKHFYIKALVCKVGAVYIGNFQLATRGRFNALGYINYAIVVEIKARHCIAGFWLSWFFFDADGTAAGIELHYAKALWVGYVIAKYSCTFTARSGGMEVGGEVLAIKNIIAEDQAAIVITDKVFANNKGLGQAIGGWLFGITEFNTKLAAIAQHLAKIGQVFWGGDNQHFADASEHQYGERIINHRFVVDRQ